MAIKHDPGPAGPSGEGETVIVAIFLCYIASVGFLFRNPLKRLLGLGESSEKDPELGVSGKISDPFDLPNDDDVKNGDVILKGKLDSDIDDDDETAIKDAEALAQWTTPLPYNPSPSYRAKFIKYTSLGMVSGDVNDPESATGAFKAFYWLSGINWLKVVIFFMVWILIWVFLVCLGLMGTGFKLLGGKDSAKMFDVVDNPISGVMIGILATVLVQSSSTSTSIIIALVGADEMDVSTAIPMVMGANIGTSVTNTLVAMGHFANPDQLRRGFAGATVHDCFNLLSVLVVLPFQWATNFLGHLTYQMAKGARACDEAVEKCDKTEFIKPYVSPYYNDVVKYDKKIATYVSEGYCVGQCGDGGHSAEEMKALTDVLCKGDGDEDARCQTYVEGFKNSWAKDDLFKAKRLPAYIQFNSSSTEDPNAFAQYHYNCPLAGGCDNIPDFWNSTMGAIHPDVTYGSGEVFAVCHKMKYGLCDARLLKGGIMLRDWDLSDEAAGSLAVFFSLSGLCAVLYLIVQSLNILVKGHAAVYLRKAVSLNGYLSMLIGVFVTIMVQSSSITTSVLTPLVAVGLIPLEDMLPLTLGANIGTTITGIMAATVVTSNPVQAWQVALCHLLFNVIGILIWYPIPFMRKIPLQGARLLGLHAEKNRWFPIIYVLVAFFAIPGVAYGIALAATS